MSEPSWAGQTVPEDPVDVVPEPDEPSRRPSLAVIGLLVLLAANIAGLIYVVSQRDSDTETVASDEVVTTTESPTTQAPTTQAPTTQAPTTQAPTTEPPTSEAPTTTEQATTTTEQATATPATGDETRTAVLSGGVLYLRGSVPSQEISDTIAERAAAVVGPDNVVVEYEIDPDAPVPDSAPLFVEDVVLFPYGSTDINPAFAPLLDLGTLLMAQNPQVVVTVVAHTDTDGSAEFNQRLSEARAAAVVKYWTDRGVDPDQIEAIALGESQPIADETSPEGAQLNRRAEFIITGLLD